MKGIKQQSHIGHLFPQQYPIIFEQVPDFFDDYNFAVLGDLN